LRFISTKEKNTGLSSQDSCPRSLPVIDAGSRSSSSLSLNQT